MVKIHTITLDNKIYNLGYKVVTQNLESLGLRKNPHILQFPINEWYVLPPEQIEEGKGDWGGIWLARTPGAAQGIAKYMQKQHNMKTRMFKTAFEDILHANDYRIKTNAINMLEEII